MDTFHWDILDVYYNKGGSQNSVNPLIKHQIDSYNKFLDGTLSQIITGFNPIKINILNKNESNNNIQKIYINVLQPSLLKPNFQQNDGTVSTMTPHIARMNNLTYSSSLYVNIHIVIENLNSDNIIEKIDKYVNNVYIGKIPIMVKSKGCILYEVPGINDIEDNSECRYDNGGYFIINGNEKVLICQDRINENTTLVFQPNNNSDGLYAEIRSMSDNIYLPPKTTSLNMSGKLNHMGRIIRINTSFFKSEIPVFTMFKALGIINDREIIQHIVYDLDNKDNSKIITELMACCEDSSDVNTQEQAEQVLIRNMSGTNKVVKVRELLQNNIINDFLPHVGKCYRRKALYLGYMIRKMIRIYLGYDGYDNRDSYCNKRIDTPGILMSNLFRQCYGKMTKEIKNLIEKELNLWRANQSVSNIDIISDSNIHRYFKQSLLDSWLKYSLSTGNWGIKSIGSFQNIRQGVSQVLNRMSYISTLSHLRRINTAMEKNGKLVQPRKLDNSQIGMICPAETPEGSSVGLVKNMALSTNISILMNSTHIRNLLVELGTFIYDDSYSYIIDNDEKWNLETDNIKNSRIKITNYLKALGNQDNVYVQINGDIIGYHNNPIELYNKLKHYKRCGIIYPMTSIIWNISQRYITISTEAGRMYRPLLIADYDNEKGKSILRINKILKEKNMKWKDFIKNKSFDSFISPIAGADGNHEEEGFIEYLDCNEINNSMIAMFPSDLEKGMKGNAMPPRYTHVEIHPSLMNGVLGVNIPFSDHNQSPRNCYQCLNENELVLMDNYSYKKIKDIVIGDKIICFNPISNQIEYTKVIYQYNRITNKQVYNINTISGRKIIATFDHKFITSNGSWKQCSELDKDTKIGIYMKPEYILNDFTSSNSFTILDNNEFAYLSLSPLNSDNVLLPIIARLAGYYYNSKNKFNNIYDKESYNKDVVYIGFKNGCIDTNFIKFIKLLNNNVNDWLFRCSKLVQQEYIAAYCSTLHINYIDIVNKILNEYGLNENWYLGDFNIMSKFYNKFGVRYNSNLLVELAGINEYLMYQENKYNLSIETDYSYEDFINLLSFNGDLMFVPFYDKFRNNNKRISDLTVESNNHSFIAGKDCFAVSNCAMGKQALGIYMSNFNKRIDTMGNILNYPQKSLVSTRLSKYTHSNDLPAGVNTIVAIMTYTGFNQEDSIMINQDALDRGLFTSTYYKAFREHCSKNHSTGEEEIFTNPINKTSKNKSFSYDKIDENGFVPKNTFVDGNDILIGKVMPKKINGKITYHDNSSYMKANDEGYIDLNYTGINSEGYKICKIRMRKNRKPEIGDKLASCSAQKGSLGMIYKHQDMPFTKSGIVPDLIMNPHAIPSRMTIGQLMECIMGKTCCYLGANGDSTPFTDCSVESIAKILETYGMERYGNEIMYNGRTGEQIKTEIFIGPTYYQRLKHMVLDKAHCVKSGHEVLTSKCWKDISEINLEDEVATLKNGKLVYEKPLEVFHYPNYKGKMYRIKNQGIELDVTINHRMYIKTCHTRKQIWSDYRLETAENIVGKMVKYKRNAEWDAIDYQFILPAFDKYEEKILDMNSWITFFGIWIAEGWAHNGKDIRYRIEFAVNKQRVKDVLYNSILKLGYNYKVNNEKLTISDKQLHAYLAPLSVGAPNKYLPEWVWSLSKEQAQHLVHSMQLGDGWFRKNTNTSVYYTSSVKLSDDFMRLLLHAGWSGMKTIHIKAGENKVQIKGRDVCNNYDIWKISVIKYKNEPSVNHGHHKKQNIQEEEVYDYEGAVYCISVPSEVFMIRKNGKPIWTGNSRGSSGPIVMMTHQASEGRSKNGGLRLGEMERDCFIGHGTSLSLKEKMLDSADNYRVFICKSCGLICNCNPEKNIYKCNYCKSASDIIQIRIPYAFKLLSQELYTMQVLLRFVCN